MSEIHDYMQSELFSDLERDALAFTEAMTQTPAKISDELFGRLRSRLSAEQMVELAAAVALENFSARFNHAFGIEPGSTEDGK